MSEYNIPKEIRIFNIDDYPTYSIDVEFDNGRCHGITVDKIRGKEDLIQKLVLLAQNIAHDEELL